MSVRGLLIAAPRSGSGKTTLALGLMRALRERGLKVASAKSGPDYIDTAFHAAASGGDGLNLDTWAMSPDLISGLAFSAAAASDMFIVEASMGLFDGVPAAIGRTGSSADVAAALGLPVLLLIDVSGQAQSAAAVVKGCAIFDPRVEIAGVVLNKVGSERHRRLVTTAIESLGLPVLGALPRNAEINLPERHLGLVQAQETERLDQRLMQLATFVSAHLDVEAVSSLARAPRFARTGAVAVAPPGQRIAVANDAAFAFMYPHLLRNWRQAGAEIFFFSPLNDEAPPDDADVCWLPGGYPELHAERLASSGRFMEGIRRFASHRPVHGECGGYMTLGKTLTDAAARTYPMAGLLSVETSFAKRRMTLGYRRAALCGDCLIGRRGQELLGHEFHYATIVDTGSDEAFALAADAYGGRPESVGSRRGHATGAFFHVIAEAG
jgi:cobyrinic acid a,c-diamide synthase